MQLRGVASGYLFKRSTQVNRYVNPHDGGGEVNVDDIITSIRSLKEESGVVECRRILARWYCTGPAVNICIDTRPYTNQAVMSFWVARIPG